MEKEKNNETPIGREPRGADISHADKPQTPPYNEFSAFMATNSGQAKMRALTRKYSRLITAKLRGAYLAGYQAGRADEKAGADDWSEDNAAE